MTTDKPFNLHDQLAADCHVLGRFDLCQVLLHRNALVTWFILVPETEVTELFDLSLEQQQAAAREVSIIAAFLKAECGATKLNYGCIGNMVSQLHLHVVSRKQDDPCWPAPVWGNLDETKEYTEDELSRLRESLQTNYGLISL